MSKFSDTLKALGYSCYDEYLDSNHWRSFRCDYYDRHPPRCECCLSVKTELHHITYERLGHERDEDVRQLCRTHHDRLHAIMKERGLPLWDSVKIIAEISCLPKKDKKQKTVATNKRLSKKEKAKRKKEKQGGKLVRSCEGIRQEITSFLPKSDPHYQQIMTTADEAVARLERWILLNIRNDVVNRYRSQKKSKHKPRKPNRVADRYWENERRISMAKHGGAVTPQQPPSRGPNASENGESTTFAVNAFFAKQARHISSLGIRFRQNVKKSKASKCKRLNELKARQEELSDPAT